MRHSDDGEAGLAAARELGREKAREKLARTRDAKRTCARLMRKLKREEASEQLVASEEAARELGRQKAREQLVALEEAARELGRQDAREQLAAAEAAAADAKEWVRTRAADAGKKETHAGLALHKLFFADPCKENDPSGAAAKALLQLHYSKETPKEPEHITQSIDVRSSSQQQTNTPRREAPHSRGNTRARRPLCQRCRAHRPGTRRLCPICHRGVGPGCAAPEGPCWNEEWQRCVDCEPNSLTDIQDVLEDTRDVARSSAS